MLTCDLWVSRMSQCCASLKVSHWATFFCSVMIQYWTPVLQQPRRCLLDLHVCNALPSPCATQTPRAEPPMPLSQTDTDSWMPTLTKRDSNLPDLLWVSTTSVSEVEMENSVTATEVWLPSYDFNSQLPDNLSLLLKRDSSPQNHHYDQFLQNYWFGVNCPFKATFL